jgi:xanthine dehydrogenase accessory factor
VIAQEEARSQKSGTEEGQPSPVLWSSGSALSTQARRSAFKRGLGPEGNPSMRDLLRNLTDALDRGRECIVCQVVETKGSTPQKAGALMVVDPDGGQLGTLGGGCVEAEVKQKAIRRLGQAGAELFSFVLDHDYAWADGLICGGKMVVLTEAVRGVGPALYYQAYHDLLEAGQGFTEAIVLDPARCSGGRVGGRFLFGPDGALVAGWPQHDPPHGLAERIEPLADRPKAASRGGVATIPTLPRVRLVIVGAGHVGQAVAELAARVDFEVWVVDDRQQYANRERFPTAREILVGPIGEVLPSLTITPHTFALIVTRGHGHDQEALYHLAPTAALYVGLIGSQRKIRLIFEGLRELGVAESALARVSAPVGFAIGSQTVPEIAVSIVAELIARRNLRGAERAPTTHSVTPCAPLLA